MNNSRAGSNVTGSTDNLSIEGQLASLAIQTAGESVYQATDLVESSSKVEASSKAQFHNVVGQHVSKRFAELMCEGVVESHDNACEIFKVVYTNGHSEEMRWEDLMKYLVPHEQPVHPIPNEMPNNFFRNDETGGGLAQIAQALPKYKRGCTKKTSSEAWGKEVTDNACPSRQTGKRGLQHSTRNDETKEMMQLERSARNDETSEMMTLRRSARNSTRKNESSEMVKLRRSTRKRKQLVYGYCEETTDDDEDDEPNYSLPPIIQVPWVDGGDEGTEGVATRGRSVPQDRRKNGCAKRHWVSLRISASSYPGKGRKIASDESEGSED